MSNKLVLQDLVDLLAKKSKITKKEADSFFRELFQIILDRIFENDSVKIKDFGTFKLVLVSSRESVDVNTGEKIEIKAHSKLSFVPDKSLKNLVNKPFSQFETILLEEGVDFEPVFEINEDSDNEPEEKEYIIDIPAEIREESSPEEQESVSEKIVEEEETSIVIEEHLVEDQNVKPQIKYPSFSQSYVYTYTATSSSDTGDSITITLPKDELSVVDKASSLQSLPSEEAIQKQRSGKIENDYNQPVISQRKEVVEEIEHIEPEIKTLDIKDLEKRIDIEDIAESNSEMKPDGVNSVAPTQIRDRHYIEPIMTSVKDHSLGKNLYLDSDSEIETEEDIVLPPPISTPSKEVEKLSMVDSESHSSSNIISDNKIVEKNIESNNHKIPYSDEDPERPLFPEDDEETITEDDFIEVYSENADSEDSMESKVISQGINNKPASIRNVSYTETIDDVDIPYHDYYAPTMGQKIKKAAPWIILGLLVFGFIGYNVIPMFNVKYDYENKLNRLNLTTADTLPLIDQEDAGVVKTPILIDSLKTKIGNKQDSVRTIPQVVPGKVDSVHGTHIPDRKISDYLKIDVINKAQQYLQRYPSKKPQEAQVGVEESLKEKVSPKVDSKPRYDTIKRGVTLRNLATKYYGNGDYWVYIYQANKSKIRNPNNIPIGTALVMPSLSTYGVNNPNDPREIQNARNMAEKILR